MKEDEDVFKEWAAKSKLLVDVGSQHGQFTKYANNLMTDGEIVCFDPDTRYNGSVKRIEPKNGNSITLHEVALGAEDGEAKMWQKGTGCMIDIRGDVPVRMVKVRRLDDYFPDRVPDFIKIDVEGYEDQVLLGMPRLLGAGVPIYIEVHHRFMEQVGKSKDDVIAIFDRFGYQMELICRNEKNWADLWYYLATKSVQTPAAPVSSS